MSDMQAIDIARRMAELGQNKEACQAYTLAIADTADPEIQFEAALYILQNGGNYQVSYDVLLDLYKNPEYQQDAFSILTGAFYEPNEKQLKARYDKNCKLLQQYPYLFRKDFPTFEDLPIRFYPFDDTLYVPFDTQAQIFQDKINFNYPQITHYFFKDLSKPILAEDVFSQYELEYLRDNVRKSEWVAKENHIYLHYSSWDIFCAYLQVLNFRNLLDSKKFVFLMEDEVSLYPIDFKEKFGINYSHCSVEPYHLEEFHKLIWHTQLASHNGGDFFNEILDAHPNIIVIPSTMLYNINNQLDKIRQYINHIDDLKLGISDDDEFAIKSKIFSRVDPALMRNEAYLFSFLFLYFAPLKHLDLSSRIIPAIFFQPHFHNIEYQLGVNSNSRATLYSEQYEEIRNFPAFSYFHYIKTFTPIRRPTSSSAAAVKFQKRVCDESRGKLDENGNTQVIGDCTLERILNRSYMVDWQDRLFQDSVLVRFEDGKLNPKATFTALAEFLDVPYTESMTYCSDDGVANVETYPGNAIGFSTKALYNTYEEYLGKAERIIMEYYLRDTYQYYGYDFQYYDGKPMDQDRINKLLDQFQITDNWMWTTYKYVFLNQLERRSQISGATSLSVDDFLITKDNVESYRERFLELVRKKREPVLITLLNKTYFVNRNGQPLQFMPLLKLDPDLLEQPLYH